MILQAIFWILLILWAVGYFLPLGATGGRIHGGIAILLFAILGYWAKGNPVNH